MTYHAVVDRFAMPIALEPWSAAVFVAAFAAAALLAARRPAYALALLILVTPFDFAREFAATTVTLPKCVLLGTLIGCAGYGAAWRRLRDPASLALVAAALAYLLATALSVAVAPYVAAGVRETLKVLEYALIGAVAFVCYLHDPDDRVLSGAVAVAAIAVSCTALAQEVVGAPSGLYVGKAIIPRIAGVLEGPNQLAGYYQIAIAILGAWAFANRSALLAFALAIATCADVLTFSRAGLFGLAAVVAILAFAGGRPAWRALRPVAWGLGAGLLVVCWWALYAHTINVLRVSLEESAYAGGVGNRGELWAAAWRMFRAHPLLGVGSGNYELELPRYGLFGVRTHANSWFLQSLAEGGLVLFAATVALVATSVGVFARALRGGSPWVVAAFAASTALALHQIADYLVFYPKVGGAWWLLLGIGAAALSRSRAGAAA